jgi:hypothetical protein
MGFDPSSAISFEPSADDAIFPQLAQSAVTIQMSPQFVEANIQPSQQLSTAMFVPSEEVVTYCQLPGASILGGAIRAQVAPASVDSYIKPQAANKCFPSAELATHVQFRFFWAPLISHSPPKFVEVQTPFSGAAATSLPPSAEDATLVQPRLVGAALWLHEAPTSEENQIPLFAAAAILEPFVEQAMEIQALLGASLACQFVPEFVE